MERPGSEDAASGGVCKQDQLEHENVQHLHCLFIDHSDSPWSKFAYLNVKITIFFKRNQWLRLWFYLGPFPHKRLNCAWSWENTTGEHCSVLTSVCAQGLGRGRLCAGLTFSSSVLRSLCEEHRSLVRSGKPLVRGQLYFTVASEHFCTALMWENGL